MSGRRELEMEHISEIKAETSTRPPASEVKRAQAGVPLRLDCARRRVGLAKNLWSKTFESFDKSRQPEAYKAAKAFLENRHSLILRGPVGTGKTHLACAIMNELLKDSCLLTGIWTPEDFKAGPVCFTTFDDALRTLRTTYNKHYEGMGEEFYIDRWRNVRLLVLDEIGQKGRDIPKDFARRIGYDIVNGRYTNGKPIVITTNQTLNGLCDWITDAAVDRLFEMGDFVETRGESYRRMEK